MRSLPPRPTVITGPFRNLEGGWPFGDHHVRIEDYEDDGTYVSRAELPGMVPEDIDIAVAGNALTITAKRALDKHDTVHSGFYHGTYARTVRLPAGTDGDKVTVTCHAGILEVTAPVAQPVETGRIPVDVTKGT